MKALTLLYYLIPLTLCQDDYQHDYLGGNTEVVDDYIFNPSGAKNQITEGSGQLTEEVIDNDDEDNIGFSKNSDKAETGSGGSDDETIYDETETANTLKPDVKEKVTSKEKPQYTEVGEEEEQPFEIEPYNPNSEDDTAIDDNDKIFNPSITEMPENKVISSKPNNEEVEVNKSSLPLPAWIDDFWGERWFVAALLGGAIVGFLIIVIVIIFICHAVRKKDEGSYIIEKDYKQGVEPKPVNNGNSERFC